MFKFRERETDRCAAVPGANCRRCTADPRHFENQAFSPELAGLAKQVRARSRLVRIGLPFVPLKPPKRPTHRPFWSELHWGELVNASREEYQTLRRRCGERALNRHAPIVRRHPPSKWTAGLGNSDWGCHCAGRPKALKPIAGLRAASAQERAPLGAPSHKRTHQTSP
jgi:hypothetical protein